MAIFRVVKDKNYSVVSNYYLRDKHLRLETIGFLTIILSMSDDYKFSMQNFLKYTKENYRTIKLILDELKTNGYLIVNKQRGDKGYYNYEYLFFESNKLNPYYNFCNMEPNKESITIYNKYNIIPPISFPSVEKYKLYINTNNYKINKDKIKINSLTEYLVKKKFIKYNDVDLFNYNNFTNELLSKYDFKKILIVINYIIKRIQSNNYKDENFNDITNLFYYFKESCLNNIKKLDTDIDNLFD